MKDTATGAAPQLNKTRGILARVITPRERKYFATHPVTVRASARTGRKHSQKTSAQPDGADQINAEHQLAVESASGAITHAIRCGELLITQKALLKHGEFGAWIEKHCAFKQAMANNYMKAARNPSAVGNSIRHLYESGRAPKEPSVNEQVAKIIGVSVSMMQKAERINREHPNRIEDLADGKHTVNGVYNELFTKSPADKVSATPETAPTYYGPGGTVDFVDDLFLKRLREFPNLMRNLMLIHTPAEVARRVKPDEVSDLITSIGTIQTWLNEFKEQLYKAVEVQS